MNESRSQIIDAIKFDINDKNFFFL